MTQERSGILVTSRVENSETTKTLNRIETLSLSSLGEILFKRYKQIELIGSGSFGIVYSVFDLNAKQ